jgi:hypothetical protein
MATLTFRKLASLKPGQWVSAGGARGAGMLAARRLAGGAVLFYFRYTTSTGARAALPLGQWDATGGPDLSLERATDLARELSTRYRTGDRDLREVLDGEARERTRQREAVEVAAAVAKATKRATLGALLSGYVEQLKRDGKASAASVEGALTRHVREAWPVLWDTPASQISTEDLLSPLAHLTDAGKLREAAKVRSYLSAAYAAAIRARQDARGLAALRALKITSNPARDLVTIDGASQARERALSVAELRAYWKRICALPDADGALLRFHLLTGGQRTEQLGRLTTDDYDTDLLSIRIRDGKGRRKVPRIHDVPLIPSAVDAMHAMGHELGPYLVTITHGHTGAVYASFQHRLRSVVEAMEQAGELEKGPFTVGDLRRTVETRLSAAGLQSGELAQLQSHGLGGVQARHYNKHDYLREKRAALETLYRLLTGKAGTVTTLHRAAKKNRA